MRVLRSIPQPLHRLWDLLTEPLPSVRVAPDRRQAKLLASLLIILMLVLGSALLRRILTDTAGTFWYEPRFWYNVVLFVLLAIFHRLSRTHFYHASALLSISTLSIGLFILALPTRDTNPTHVLNYLVIPVFLSSILLSTYTTTLLIAAHTGGLLVFLAVIARTNPSYSLNPAIFSSPLVFTLVISSVILLFTYHRDKMEQDRQAILRTSESKYRMLIEQATEGIGLLDQQGNYIEVNPALGQMLGYTHAELLPLSIEDLLPEEDLKASRLS